MDSVIKKLLTIGIPSLILFMTMPSTGKAGATAFWASVSKLGEPFGLRGGITFLLLVGLVTNSISDWVIDGCFVGFYHKRRQSELPEKLLRDIDKLPLSHDLKIKLKWTVIHKDPHPFQWSILFSRLFQSAAIVTALLSIAGYFGGLDHLLELTAHFKWQYLVSGICTLIFFGLRKQKKVWLVISAFCILINLAEIMPFYWPQSAVAVATTNKPLRILFSNVLASNQRYGEVLSLVKEEQPDVAVFVEVSKSWAKNLNDLKPMFAYTFSYRDNYKDKFGTAIYSKVPLENKSINDFSGGHKALGADIKIQNRSLSLLTVHLSTPTRNQNFLVRNQQISGINEYVAQARNPVIVVGDFNITMWSPIFKEMVKNSALKNARIGFGILPTWPTDKPLLYIPLDHCLVSQEIDVLKVRTGHSVGSDHLPLIVDVAIAEKHS